MNKILQVITVAATVIGFALLLTAGFLIVAPELLTGFWRVFAVVACVLTGLGLLIPLVITLLNAVNSSKRKSRKEEVCVKPEK